MGQTDAGMFQTVEVGWNVDESIYDDTPPGQTHLFIYSTADNYATTGCYNDWAWTGSCAGPIDDAGQCALTTCVPWVQVSKQYVPGMVLPTSTVGHVKPGNPSSIPKELSLTTVQIDGNWWILMQVSGEGLTPLGYYAGSSINGPLTDFMGGAEVCSFNATTGEPTSFANIAMGSGREAREGQGFAAYQRNFLALVGSGANTRAVLNGEVCSTVTDGYTFSLRPAPVVEVTPWVDYFYFGGDPSSSTQVGYCDGGACSSAATE